MSIAFTSRLSWKEAVANLTPQCRRVWEAIRDFRGEPGPSIHDLGTMLTMQTATVSARIHDLREAGAIEDGPIKVGVTRKRQKTYRALLWREPAPEPGQLSLL